MGRLQLVPIPGPQGGMMMLGLDLTQAEVAWRLSGIEMTRDLWEQVQLIETGAKDAFNETTFNGH